MKIGAQIFRTLLGLLFGMIGIINLITPNDPGYGIFVLLCSLLFYPGVWGFVAKRFPVRMHAAWLIVLWLFLLWTALGAGDLFPKVHYVRYNLLSDIPS